MRRTTPLSRCLALAAFSLLLAGSGCSMSIGGWSTDSADVFGNSVSTRDGKLVVDGTPLPFDRWVDVTVDTAGMSQLELVTATDAIRVSGAAGTLTALRARLYSEIEGDGTAVIEDGRLVARSTGAGKVFINAIEGTVPAALALAVRSGTGDIELSALAGTAELDLTNGTGNIALRDSTTGSLLVKQGTGDVDLADVGAPSFECKTGTGAVEIARLRTPHLKVKSGTGDVGLTNCEVETLNISTGTGNLLLDGGNYGQVDFETGTGDLTQRNAVIKAGLKVT